MAILQLVYKSKRPLPSCQPGEHEIQPGAEVIVPLKPKNPLWPEYIKGVIQAPIEATPKGRIYRINFDDAQLNGGPVPDPCDFAEPRCFSCCDALREELATAGVLVGNPPEKLVIFYRKSNPLDTQVYQIFVAPVWQADGTAVVVWQPPGELPPMPQYELTLTFTGGKVLAVTGSIVFPVQAIVVDVHG